MFGTGLHKQKLNVCQCLCSFVEFCLFVVILFRFYGCGLVVPEALEGMHVLDLGSGSGQDCFVLSKLVGENGYVTGVDMTKEQVSAVQAKIEKAERVCDVYKMHFCSKIIVEIYCSYQEQLIQEQ